MATNSPPPISSTPAVPPTSTTSPPLPSGNTAPPPSATTPPLPSNNSAPPPSSTTPPLPSDTTAPTPSAVAPPLRSATTTTPPPLQQPSSPPMENPRTPPPAQPNASPPDPTTPPAGSPPPQTVVPSVPPPQPPVTSSPPPPQPSESPPPLSLPQPPPSENNPPASSSSPPPQPPPSNSPPPQPPIATPPPTSRPTPTSPPPATPSSPPPNPPPSQPSDPPTGSPPSNPGNNTPQPPPSAEPRRRSPPQRQPPPAVEPPEDSSPPPPLPVPPESPPTPPASAPPRSSPSRPPPNEASPPAIQTPSPPASESSPSPPNSTSNPSPGPPTIRPSPPQTLVPPADNTNVNNSRPVSPDSSNLPSNNGIGTPGVVAIAVAVGIIALSLIGLAFWCFRKRRKEASGVNGGYVIPSPLSSIPITDSSTSKTQSSAPMVVSGSGSGSAYSPTDPGGLGNSRSFFTYEELIKATNGFSDENLLGKGGFGSVYKGYLPDGREVAIKQLKIGGGQGEREFKAEVEIISRIHHRHLVSLVGYCISEKQRLLIYEYVPNNTLYFHLHGEGKPVLDWTKRVRIAVGAARGIAYLHEDCHPRIIHRDIKSSNILLDNNFEARVSDFGLAKLALDANTHITTRVMGTFGYMAPEYATSGKLTEKSDVFSFGVVLLELITGRKPVDTSQPVGDESLVEWARPLLSHALENEEFDNLADPKLGKDYVGSEMFRMIEAAAACVRHSAAKRPRMGQVVRAFDDLAVSDLSNGMKVGESEIYDTAQQSAEIRWFRRMAFGSQNFSTDFFSHSSSGDNSGKQEV